VPHSFSPLLPNNKVLNSGLVICPSRELAKQTFDIVQHFTEFVRRFNLPEIRSCLAIGGVPVAENMDLIGK
jgi:ATP-dependent RNA helicase DDX41